VDKNYRSAYRGRPPPKVACCCSPLRDGHVKLFTLLEQSDSAL